MRVPVYLEIAQWALLFALGLLVVVLYRQLGRLMGNAAKTPDLGPAVGTMATPFRFQTLPDGMTAQFRPGGGQSSLVAFVDPTCPACEQLVTNLGQLAAGGELAGARVLLLISDPPSYLAISAAFRDTALQVGRPLSAQEVTRYRASGTPLLVSIDSEGVVRAAGVARLVPEIRSFAAAAARGAAMSRVAAEASTSIESEAVR
ncbi:MAG: hypothetical protein ACLQFR_30260 [Streptosporangiaceae bacterium]